MSKYLCDHQNDFSFLLILATMCLEHWFAVTKKTEAGSTFQWIYNKLFKRESNKGE